MRENTNAAYAPRDGGDAAERLGALAALRRALPGSAADPSRPQEGSSEVEAAAAAADPASRFSLLASPPPTSGFRLPASGFRLSPLIAGLCAATLAVALVGGLTYFAARTFTGRAADSRASEEAGSFAGHSSTLATGDAFLGYLQILRYAEDNVLRAEIATREQREAVLQQQVYLNTNRMYALAVADRQGRVLASVGMELDELRASEAFNRSLSSNGPANSDIILPESGASGYVEFAMVLTDAADATPWGVLYGRANPSVLWRPTLNASIDGSRNVIINEQGQFAAGVPSDLIGEPWRGAPLASGGVRAEIAGVDSICGLGPIGAATQIDRGWAVASCLPASLVQVEANDALGQLALIVVAACVLAIVLAGTLLRLLLGDPGSAARAEAGWDDEPAVSAEDERETLADAGAVIEQEHDAQVGDPDLADDAAVGGGIFDGARDGQAGTPDLQATDAEPSASTPIATIIAPDIDALELIAAYEARNERLAAQLRERLAAPLMIAASQAEDAFNGALAGLERQESAEGADEESPGVDIGALRRLHEQAIGSIEMLRERETRSIAQALHPGLVALGLPSALRSLLADAGVRLTLDIDPATDSVDGGHGGRAVVDDARRLVAYRAAREAIDALRTTGAEACELALSREGEDLIMTVASDGSIADRDVQAARLAAEAYGGSLRVNDGGGMELRLPAPSVVVAVPQGEFAASATLELAQTDRDEAAAATIDDADGAAERVRIVTLPAEVHRASSLRVALETLVSQVPGISVALDVDEALDDDAVDVALREALRSLTAATLPSLAGAGASSVRVWVRRIRDDVFATITSGGARFATVDSPAFDDARRAIEARGGSVSVATEPALAISVEAPLEPAAAHAA